MTTQDADTAPVATAPVDGGAAVHPAAPVTGRRRGRVALVAGLLVVAVAGGATAYTRASSGGPAPRDVAAARPVAAAPADPTVVLVGAQPDGSVPWRGRLVVAVAAGTLTSVTGTDGGGGAVTGELGADGRWSSTTALFPSSAYTLRAQVRDAAGATRTLPLTATTTAPDKTFSVSLAPGDGAAVGVGQALSVRLSTPVTDKASRAALEGRLAVTTTPAVEGAWHWTSSSELRYRGAAFWAAGTKITVSASLDRLQAAPGVWGAGTRTSTFTVGDSLTSVVDTVAHTMTVSRNGQVLRVMRASMGKPEFATRNGTFVVLEKFADKVMDSSTVDLPPGTPPYKTAVKDAVRITNSGTFTHGAPWSIASQGVANVSHGCINLSPDDAHWYFLQVKRGDVVTVVNSTTGPVLSDAGSQDWNMSFATWKAGSATA